MSEYAATQLYKLRDSRHADCSSKIAPLWHRKHESSCCGQNGGQASGLVMTATQSA